MDCWDCPKRRGCVRGVDELSSAIRIGVSQEKAVKVIYANCQLREK
jgi:hypothetical protein